MDLSPSHETLLNQSVIRHLHLSLKGLDLLGASIAAAHVDAALQILINTSTMNVITSETDEFRGHFDPELDVSCGKDHLITYLNAEGAAEAEFPEIGAMI